MDKDNVDDWRLCEYEERVQHNLGNMVDNWEV